MIVSIIVAVSENRVIGKNNDLIWKLPNVMNFFKEKTKGHHVIMGRKNFESIPHKFRPLPQRENIIVTRQKTYSAKDSLVVNSIEEALKIAENKNEKEAFIIGGGEIYSQTIELVDKIELTRVYKDYKGDAFFPKIPEEKFKLIKDDAHELDGNEKIKYSFLTYIKK